MISKTEDVRAKVSAKPQHNLTNAYKLHTDFFTFHHSMQCFRENLILQIQ